MRADFFNTAKQRVTSFQEPAELTEKEHPGTRATEEQRRRSTARTADANLRIEGLSLSDEARALKEAYVKGELTAEQWLGCLKARHSAEDCG